MIDFLLAKIDDVRSALDAAIAHIDPEHRETEPHAPRWLKLESLLVALETAHDSLNYLDDALVDVETPPVSQTGGVDLQLNDDGRDTHDHDSPTAGQEQAPPG